MTAHGDHIRAIGWLSDQHPFPTGDTSPEFLARLKDFCRRWGDGLEPLAWTWSSFLGSHRCELCGRCTAGGNIGVPAGDVLFAAPEMVAHYVEAHRYVPPADFVAAVLAAPLPGTPEYHEAAAAFREVKLRQLAEWRAGLDRRGQPPQTWYRMKAREQPDLLLKEIEELRRLQAIAPTQERAAKIVLYEEIYRNGELLRAFIDSHSPVEPGNEPGQD